MAQGRERARACSPGPFLDDVLLTSQAPSAGGDYADDDEVLPNGATFNDLIEAAAVGAKNYGAFVSAVAKLTNERRKAGLIRGTEKGKIMSCA